MNKKKLSHSSLNSSITSVLAALLCILIGLVVGFLVSRLLLLLLSNRFQYLLYMSAPDRGDVHAYR